MVLKKVRSNGMFLVSEGKEILPFIGLQVMLQVFSLRLGVKSSLCYILIYINNLLIQSPSF